MIYISVPKFLKVLEQKLSKIRLYKIYPTMVQTAEINLKIHKKFSKSKYVI